MHWIGLVALIVVPGLVNSKSRHSRSDTTTTALSRPPQGLRVDRKQERSLDLSWTEINPAGTVQGYYVYYHSSYGNQTSKLEEPQTRIRLSDLEPGTTYRIWIIGYQLRNKSEMLLGPESEAIEVTTKESALKSPQVVNLSCIPPDELLIEWTSDIRPDLYFILRYRPGNASSSYTQQRLTVNASGSDFNHWEYALKSQTLEGWYEIGLRSVVNENEQAWGGRRESEWSETRMVFCNNVGASAAESIDNPDHSFPSLVVPALLIAGTTILLTCLLLGLFFWRKFYSGSYYYLDNPSLGLGSQGAGGWEGDDSSRAAVEIQLFPNHVAELHRDGDIGFSKEYEAITGVEEDFSSIHSSHPDNKLKNRYLNILAYDHTRVRLECNGTPKKSSDYVNGNYIDGFERPKAYIGTQGPLPSTFEAFWQLVWENQVAIIIMITNLTERGRKKCDQYWPSIDANETYGLVQVRLVKEQTMATYILRTFSLKHLKSKKRLNCDERLVWQFHYTVWPDHGTPSHPLPVLSFVRKSSAANPPDGGPIIVHCSAGVGRTGTYIVLDAMLRQIAKRGDLNIFGFLRHIRRQRNFLVQTEEQYIFCHDVLLEAIQSGDTNVSLSRLPHYLKNLVERTYVKDDGQIISMFQRQYELVIGTDPKNHFCLISDKKCNIPKNRPGALKPTDNSRVLLIPKPGVDGSDYINASFLSGFSKVREFILTPHPTETTLHHFWQMLCDHNVSTVVLLSLVDDEDFEVFWPEPEADLNLDGLVIKHVSGSDRVGIATRSFAIIQEDDDELNVNLIQSSSWPRHSSTPTDLFELIQYVQDSAAESNTTGPIVVVDRFGGTEGATFCTLTTICNQLDSEAHLDIYLYAKLYHDHRPGIWPTFDDYAFLYESIDGLTKGRRNSEQNHLNGPHPPSPLAPLSRAPPMLPPPAPPKETEVKGSDPIDRSSPEPATIIFETELESQEVEECELISTSGGGVEEEIVKEETGEEPVDLDLEPTDFSPYVDDVEDEGEESNSELIPHNSKEEEAVKDESQRVDTHFVNGRIPGVKVEGIVAEDEPEASVD